MHWVPTRRRARVNPTVSTASGLATTFRKRIRLEKTGAHTRLQPDFARFSQIQARRSDLPAKGTKGGLIVRQPNICRVGGTLLHAAPSEGVPGLVEGSRRR